MDYQTDYQWVKIVQDGNEQPHFFRNAHLLLRMATDSLNDANKMEKLVFILAKERYLFKCGLFVNITRYIRNQSGLSRETRG
ncbi:MAG: hypothetical protein EBQ97_06240 [Bacteroidetes bacterium]|nr:hypothetical protein [Bacteroidota bacterium]